MAKTKISEYDSTAANNTDVDSVNIAEGCAPSGINNAIREVMSHLKDFQTGAAGDSLTVGGNFSVTGTVTIPDNAISGDKVEGGTINAITINTLSANPTLSAGTANGVTYLNGSKVLTSGSAMTFNGSTLDVTGTVTANGLTVDGDVAISSTNSRLRLFETDATDLNTQLQNSAGDFNISTLADDAASSSLRLKLDHATGDISFYEDTGTTPKFFWDASAESLGIGTSSPASYGKFAVRGSVNLSPWGDVSGHFSDAATGSLYIAHSSNKVSLKTDSDLELFCNNSGDSIILSTNASERLRLDSSGNLGLGVTPVSQNGKVFQIDGGAGAADIRLTNNATGSAINNGGLLTLSGSDIYLWNLENNILSFGTNNTERMRIDSSGNVGIGTSSPSYKLDLSTSFDGRARVWFAALAIAGNNSNGTGYQIRTPSSTTDGFVLSNGGNSAEYLRIDSSGNLNIGDSGNFGGKFSLVFNPASQHGIILAVSSATFTNDYIAFQNSGGSKIGSISSNNSSVAYNTSSDYRLKENVVGVTSASERVQQLNPVRFNFIADPDRTVDGFLAHEVAEVVPEAITGEKDAVDADGNPKYQGIDQSKLVPLLTAALQEALAEINSLKARLDAANL